MLLQGIHNSEMEFRRNSEGNLFRRCSNLQDEFSEVVLGFLFIPWHYITNSVKGAYNDRYTYR